MSHRLLLLTLALLVAAAACTSTTDGLAEDPRTREGFDDSDAGAQDTDSKSGDTSDDHPDEGDAGLSDADDPPDDPERPDADNLDEPDLPPDEPDDPPEAPLGSWDNPIEVAELPFSDRRDTRDAPSFEAERYTPCAPSTDESGGEFVYRVSIPEAGVLRARLAEASRGEVDIDVHILSSPSSGACVARGHQEASAQVQPGTAWVVADTWVNAQGDPQAGPYDLTLTLTPPAPPGDPNDCLTSPITCDDQRVPPPGPVPTEAPGDPGCLPGMARVGVFCVDRFEASLAIIESDRSLSPWSPYLNPGQRTVRAISAAGTVPQGYINQLQAGAACAQAGKRLCTDTEWLRACQGAQDRTYPYGSTFQSGVCNTVRACHPVVQYFESTADRIWSQLDHPCINQLPEGLAPTGQYDGCQTPEGVFDMSGNLHEWTADPSGTFRGGFYVDAVRNGPGCLYRTTAHNTAHWDYSTGFRCCADANP